MTKDKKWSLMLFFIFLLTFTLRLKLAIQLPIWIDEAIVFNLAKNYSFFDLVMGNFWDASHPPLLHLITKVQLLFIPEKFILVYRMFHIFFASIAIIPLSIVLYKVSNSKFATTLGLLFYASHPLIMENTFSVRPYSLVVFCFTLFLLINPSFNKELFSLRKFIFTNSLIAFSFYLDYSSLWFLIPFFLIVLYKNRSIKKVLVKFWPSILIISLWIPNFINNFHQMQALNEYARDKSFQFFIEEIFGIVNFWNRSEYISKFGYFLYLCTFLFATVSFFVKQKKYRIYSLYFLLPTFFIYAYSQLNSPAFISRQFISLAVISTIVLASIVKNKSLTLLAFSIIILNLIQSYSLTPNFRYLSFQNGDSIVSNTNELTTILYPYYNLDALDYFLRSNDFLKIKNTYDPVIYIKDNKKISAYITNQEQIKSQQSRYFFMHKQDVTGKIYFENLQNFCKIPEEKTKVYLKNIDHFLFLDCN